MTRSDLYSRTARNQYNTRMILESEYSSIISQEGRRLLGRLPDDFVENVIERMMKRIPDVKRECDLWFVLYDCVRAKVILILRQAPDLLKTIQDPALEKCCSVDAVMAHHDVARFKRILSHMTTKQRVYFFDRYYFFRNDVPENRRNERKISCIFKRYGVTSPLVELERLDPQILSNLDSLNSKSAFEVTTEASLGKSIVNYQMNRLHYFLVYGMPAVLILFLIFTIWYFCFRPF